jgi:hypothetical protein
LDESVTMKVASLMPVPLLSHADSAVTGPTTTAVGAKPYTAPARQIWAWGIGALATHLLIQTYGQAYDISRLALG